MDFATWRWVRENHCISQKFETKQYNVLPAIICFILWLHSVCISRGFWITKYRPFSYTSPAQVKLVIHSFVSSGCCSVVSRKSFGHFCRIKPEGNSPRLLIIKDIINSCQTNVRNILQYRLKIWSFLLWSVAGYHLNKLVDYFNID